MSKTSDKTITESNLRKEVALNDSSFDDFVKKFSTDSSFQLLRIKFPLVYYYSSEDEEGVLSTKKIHKEEWKIINLVDIKEYGEAVEIKKKTKGSDSVDLVVEGIDTGLSVIYCFKKENNKWYLTKIIDQSN